MKEEDLVKESEGRLGVLFESAWWQRRMLVVSGKVCMTVGEGRMG